MNVSERLHELYGADRRVRVLSRQIVSVLPRNASILDVGCGDGEIDRLVGELREDVDIRGIDVLVRPDAKIPVKEFDGLEIPYPDDSFDGVVFVDVLHHSDDAKKLLGEACRVARSFIVIKDHRMDGFLAFQTLRFMDDVGNARFGVRLPYNYWTHDQWQEAFRELGVDVASWSQDLAIYPWPASMLFDRGLHFLAKLDVAKRDSGKPDTAASAAPPPASA